VERGRRSCDGGIIVETKSVGERESEMKKEEGKRKKKSWPFFL